VKTSVFSLGLALAVAGAGAACSDSSGPGSAGTVELGLTVSTSPRAGSAPGFAPESVTVGQHHLVLTKVEIVLREIELRRAAATTSCGRGSDNASANGGDDKGSNRRADNECLEVEIGPLLVDLPLGGGTKRLVTATVDTGTFEAVQFTIHKLGSREGDQAFLAQHPDLEGISMRAVGTYDGTPFQFASGVTVEQVNSLSPALTITGTGSTYLTLEVEVGSWFVAGGVGLIDPATANEGGPNASLVRENIRRSFHAFSDRDQDGKRDR
jgi:hypothetical protein